MSTATSSKYAFVRQLCRYYIMLLVEPCYVGLFRVCSKNKYCRKV